MQANSIEIVQWCSECNKEPAVGDVTFQDEQGEEIDLPVGWECLNRYEEQGHDLAGFSEFKHLIENSFNWKTNVEQPPLF